MRRSTGSRERSSVVSGSHTEKVAINVDVQAIESMDAAYKDMRFMLMDGWFKQWRGVSLLLIGKPMNVIRYTAAISPPVVQFVHLKNLAGIKAFDTDDMGRKNICRMTFDNGGVILLSFASKSKAQAWTDAICRIAMQMHQMTQFENITTEQSINALDLQIKKESKE
eukprot:jgi/Hompol1/4963/HPOL_004061-RA